MPPQTVLICLGLLPQVVVVFGQTKYRVDEKDSPLPRRVMKTLKSGKPMLEIILFKASHKCSKEYLVETKDHIYVDFVAGNPDSRLTFEKPGPQVVVGIINASNLIICIRGFTDCGSTYNDLHGLPCNCKDISTPEYTAVRVKGYWKLNPTASGGDYLIIWEEQVDPFLNSGAKAINIIVSRKIPKIIEEDPSCVDSEPNDGTSWVLSLVLLACSAILIGIVLLVVLKRSTKQGVIARTDGQARSEDAQSYRPSDEVQDPNRASIHSPNRTSMHSPNRASIHSPNRTSMHSPNRASIHSSSKASKSTRESTL